MPNHRDTMQQLASERGWERGIELGLGQGMLFARFLALGIDMIGVDLGLRPENVTIVEAGAGTLDADAMIVERLGDRTIVYAQTADGSEITALDKGDSRVRMGDKVGLSIDGRAAHLFGSDGTGYHAGHAA